MVTASSFSASAKGGVQRLAFVLLVTTIAVVGSERFFWFWTPSLAENGEGVLFYALPVGVTLWAIQAYRVSGRWSLLLVVPLFAYLTEGLLTPILYSGGPFVPFFPVWFTGWHGLLSIYILVFGIRRWLLAGETTTLLGVSLLLGTFWGAWSSTLRLPESVEDEELLADLGELVVLDPMGFANYAATFTGVLVAAHVLLNWVWPTSFLPGRLATRTTAFIVVAGVVAWTVVLPWALPMFAVYVALQVWALRSHRDAAHGPNLFAQLHGSFPIWQVWPLTTIAGAATAVYWGLWELDPSDTALEIIFYGSIAVQTIVAGVLMVRSIRRARRARTAPATEPQTRISA